MIAITFACGLGAADAQARSRGHSSSYGTHSATPTGSHGRGYSYGGRTSRYSRHAYRGSLRHWASSGLQCVPFARENTGIELSGNAVTWWDKADGLYERGAHPEVGSILNFRATGRMPMGHVAVVTNVVNGRHIQIDHAIWSAPGQISRDIDVVDVSSSNDWTAVRVELAETQTFGSVYPTYGFIYDRPDSGVMVANSERAPAPLLAAAPSDQRSPADRIQTAVAPTAPEEVAEAVDDDAGPVRSTRHSRRLRSVRLERHSRMQLALNAAPAWPARSGAAVHGSRHSVAKAAVSHAESPRRRRR